MNPLLMLDLDTAQSSLMPVDESAQQAFIGGRGLGVSILSEQRHIPDPLDPASLLCMLVGPLNGTKVGRCDAGPHHDLGTSSLVDGSVATLTKWVLAGGRMCC